MAAVLDGERAMRGQRASFEGETDGVEDGEATSSRGLDDRSDIGVEGGPPLRAEAVGHLPEDDAGSERLLGTVVGGRHRAVSEKDEEVLVEALEQALELAPGCAGGRRREQRAEPRLETRAVGGKRRVGEIGPPARDAD